MGRQFRIRVYGTQRHNIDPVLLAQIVILFGRQLHQRQQQQQQSATGHARVEQGCPSPRSAGKSEVTNPKPPRSENTSPIPQTDEDNPGDTTRDDGRVS
jgi:hypothetical protein